MFELAVLVLSAVPFLLGLFALIVLEKRRRDDNDDLPPPGNEPPPPVRPLPTSPNARPARSDRPRRRSDPSPISPRRPVIRS